jgi:DNA-binding NtrC family response regulator
MRVGRGTAVGQQAPEANGDDPARPAHILVVNDTQEILELFRAILEEEGYRLSLYSYAFDDLVVIKQERPDLIILDLLIGNEDHGWQLLQKLKMDRATASIPVIVCSAALHLLRQLEGHLKEKNVTVVPKPFDIDDLLRAVTRVLDQRDEATGSTGVGTAPRGSAD